MQSIVAKQCGCKTEELSSNIINYCYEKFTNHMVYNISYLERMKNPKAAKNKKIKIEQKDLLITKNKAMFKRDVEIDGFEGTIYKSIAFKITKKMKDLLAKINELEGKIVQCEVKETEVEYKRLILSTDKSVKAKFIKKIINTSDIKTLLLD